MYNMHSPTTPSSRLYIPPTQGRREYPSVITAPCTFDAKKINLPEGTVQMQSGEILSSTRVPLQPDHTACLPQPAHVAPHPSIPTQAVTNSQASSFPQPTTSSPPGQAASILTPAPETYPSHPKQTITTQQPASTSPGQLATSLQGQAASLPLTP